MSAPSVDGCGRCIGVESGVMMSENAGGLDGGTVSGRSYVPSSRRTRRCSCAMYSYARGRKGAGRGVRG